VRGLVNNIVGPHRFPVSKEKILSPKDMKKREYQTTNLFKNIQQEGELIIYLTLCDKNPYRWLLLTSYRTGMQETE
jgi:hypothetical protein